MSNYQTLKQLITQSTIRRNRDKYTNNTKQFTKETLHLQELQNKLDTLTLRSQ